jgi:predicted lipoprotein
MRRCPVLAGAVTALFLAACAPWTVRPIDDKADEQPTPTARNPAQYVESIWSSKLVPAVLNSAVDARTLLDALARSPDAGRAQFGHREANGPWYFIVKGEGRVVSVDTKSRAGSMLVDIPPFDGHGDVSVQIGPVLRGTSLRDATGIVHFSDFVNQLQFADAANAMNDRVLKSVLTSLSPATLIGRIVRFAGTASAEPGEQPPIRDLVPAQLTTEQRP